MNLKRRLDRLTGADERDRLGEMAMTDAERGQASLRGNCIVRFEPDLRLVERRDCQPGDAGQFLYLYARENTLWYERKDREAERTRAMASDLQRRAAARGRSLKEPEDAEVRVAIARALKRLGRTPTPPMINMWKERSEP